MYRHFAFGSLAVLVGCSSGAGFDTVESDASLRIHRTLRGGERVAEVIDDNRIRVLASNYGSVQLGQCTDPLGNPFPQQCLAQEETTQAYSERGTVVALTDLQVKPYDLQRGDFRLYMRTLDVDAEASFGAGVVAATGRAQVRKFEVIEEWSRYENYSISSPSQQMTGPYVASIDYGIAVRMVMVVEVLDTESSVSAEAGFGNLDAALATNRSSIAVSFEVLGVRVESIPERPPRITSNEQFYAAQNEFHQLIRRVQTSWSYESHDGPRPSFYLNSGDPNYHDESEKRVRPTVLAYYVEGLLVGEAQARLDRRAGRCDAQFVSCIDGVFPSAERCARRLDSCYEWVSCRRESLVLGYPPERCYDSTELLEWAQLGHRIMSGSPYETSSAQSGSGADNEDGRIEGRPDE